MTDNPPRPTPRLRHAQPGRMVILAGERKIRILLGKDDQYGYFDSAKASLCHPVEPSLMVFGDGHGWRSQESTHER